MSNILIAKNIIKSFPENPEVQILKGVSFAVAKGEFLSIIGKSGCGKSTLLYVLSTMDTDYTGSLEMVDKALNGLSQNELAKFRNEHLGFVFQFHYLLPEFSVLKNVMMPAMKLNKYTKEELEYHAIEKLKLVDMQDYALKTSAKLSGGQQQRVAIARALINNPTIIMCDEPTGNLDKNNSRKVFEIFKRLIAENNQTIITVTHDSDFANDSDRVIEMSDGTIVK
ncbi:MAG: hypothetical protein RJA07_320 [Bacteroidota bacterium]|jgi:lipoprotein-releasing system ATP-binding protein